MRILTLALTVFGLVYFTVIMAVAQTAEVISHLPDSRAGIGWIIGLVMIPTVVTGLVSGLTAALGAYVGKRTAPPEIGAPKTRLRMSLGAGIGGSLGSALFLIYLSWFYQGGPGLWILVLGYIVIFAAYAGFTALLLRRGTGSSQLPV